jgi:ABC-type Fe3+ transport system substrate-binding protein
MRNIPQSIASVPLYAPHGEWYVAALSIFGIISNSVAVERLHLTPPETWADLAKPEYFDLVGLADPRKSGSMHAMYEVILQGYGWTKGWQLLSEIAGNARAISANASQVGKDVSTGEVVFGIAIDTYAGDIIRKVGGGRITFTRPKDFSSVNGDAIAALVGAPHPELARQFIEFVVSEKGQKIWYYKAGTPGGPRTFEIGKLPIIPALYDTGTPATVASGNPFTWPNILPYDSDKASARWNIVNDLFGSFVVDVHDRITLFRKRYPTSVPPIPVIAESEVSRLSPAGAWGEDQLLRNRMLNEWGASALSTLPADRSPLYPFRWLPTLGFSALLIGVIAKRLSRRRRPTHS